MVSMVQGFQAAVMVQDELNESDMMGARLWAGVNM